MNKIRIVVSPKVFSIAECVKLSPSTNYSDTIVKGFDYSGESQRNVSITNYCNQPFNIPEIILFNETLGGSNFSAKLNPFPIGALQTLNVPVLYNGIYLASNLAPNYPISLNGNSAVYSLIIDITQEKHPPIVTDVILNLDSGEEWIFNVADFLAHFTDIDGDNLSAVIIEGDTSNYTLNGVTLVSGTEIPRVAIEAGQLKYLGVTTATPIEVANVWKARDSSGEISI